MTVSMMDPISSHLDLLAFELPPGDDMIFKGPTVRWVPSSLHARCGLPPSTPVICTCDEPSSSVSTVLTGKRAASTPRAGRLRASERESRLRNSRLASRKDQLSASSLGGPLVQILED